MNKFGFLEEGDTEAPDQHASAHQAKKRNGVLLGGAIIFVAVVIALNVERTGSSGKSDHGTDSSAQTDRGAATAMLSLPWNKTLRLVRISAGTFTMGSSVLEDGRSNNETQHHVTITKDFWLGETEITQEQYESVMGTNPSEFKGAQRPVENVSWEDAMAFCQKVTERERAAGELTDGSVYTLPTEAQWEYACRAGTTSALNNGKNLTAAEMCCNLDDLGWYKANSGAETHPVGQKKPNAWGLYDMHGNVWEWCSDWYGAYPVGTVVDPVGASSGSSRVLRGGSWCSFAQNCRSANRVNSAPSARFNDLGFRLARTLP